MGHIQNELPEGVLDVANGSAVGLAKIHWAALCLQFIEDLHELLMRFLLLVHALPLEK